ncbi:MAG: hypothetical protein [Microviridae sp.]|nr:MAG: hypothetical protein [Microviridae sp.]
MRAEWVSVFPTCLPLHLPLPRHFGLILSITLIVSSIKTVLLLTLSIRFMILRLCVIVKLSLLLTNFSMMMIISMVVLMLTLVVQLETVTNTN